jgi:hypothetical protein
MNLDGHRKLANSLIKRRFEVRTKDGALLLEKISEREWRTGNCHIRKTGANEAFTERSVI